MYNGFSVVLVLINFSDNKQIQNTVISMSFVWSDSATRVSLFVNFRRINKWLAQGLDLGEGYSVLLFYKSIDVYCCMTSAWAIVKENIVIHMNGVFFNFSLTPILSSIVALSFLPSFIHCPLFIHYFSVNITMIFYSNGNGKKKRGDFSITYNDLFVHCCLREDTS